MSKDGNRYAWHTTVDDAPLGMHNISSSNAMSTSTRILAHKIYIEARYMGITAHALLKMCNLQSFVTNVNYDGWNLIIIFTPLIKAKTIFRVLAIIL